MTVARLDSRNDDEVIKMKQQVTGLQAELKEAKEETIKLEEQITQSKEEVRKEHFRLVKQRETKLYFLFTNQVRFGNRFLSGHCLLRRTSYMRPFIFRQNNEL